MKVSARKTPNAKTVKVVTLAIVSTSSRETFVSTSTNVIVKPVATRMLNVSILKEISRVAAWTDTLEAVTTVSADNVKMRFVPLTRSACRQGLKSANVKTVFASIASPIVSTLTSVKRLFAPTKLAVQIQLAVMSVRASQQHWQL